MENTIEQLEHCREMARLYGATETLLKEAMKRDHTLIDDENLCAENVQLAINIVNSMLVLFQYKADGLESTL